MCDLSPLSESAARVRAQADRETLDGLMETVAALTAERDAEAERARGLAFQLHNLGARGTYAYDGEEGLYVRRRESCVGCTCEHDEECEERASGGPGECCGEEIDPVETMNVLAEERDALKAENEQLRAIVGEVVDVLEAVVEDGYSGRENDVQRLYSECSSALATRVDPDLKPMSDLARRFAALPEDLQEWVLSHDVRNLVIDGTEYGMCGNAVTWFRAGECGHFGRVEDGQITRLGAAEAIAAHRKERGDA